MVEEEYININFVQRGPICVLACYGIILEYFTSGDITVDGLLLSYRRNYKDLDNEISKEGEKTKAAKFSKMQSGKIFKHFHEQCVPTNKRGYKFIEEIHENNVLGTKLNIQIVEFKADTSFISVVEKEGLKNRLINGGNIAMVLYHVKEGLFHSVVVWYNEEKGDFGFRDPETKEISYKNTIDDKDITEFIVFDEIINEDIDDSDSEVN